MLKNIYFKVLNLSKILDGLQKQNISNRDNVAKLC